MDESQFRIKGRYIWESYNSIKLLWTSSFPRGGNWEGLKERIKFENLGKGPFHYPASKTKMRLNKYKVREINRKKGNITFPLGSLHIGK